VALIPDEDQGQYGPTLLKVLSDPAYRAELAERSRKAQERYFSWKAIAGQYAEALCKQSRSASE
jgi:glycosyltransferase involved in cell wall biosynthesis